MISETSLYKDFEPNDFRCELIRYMNKIVHIIGSTLQFINSKLYFIFLLLGFDKKRKLKASSSFPENKRNSIAFFSET